MKKVLNPNTGNRIREKSPVGRSVKQKYKEEREKNPMYIEYQRMKEERKEKIKELRKTAKAAKEADKTKTRKMRSSKAGIELKI